MDIKQKPVGELTNNIGNSDITIKNITQKSKKVTNDLESNDIPQISKDNSVSLDTLFDNKPKNNTESNLGDTYTQLNPGELTQNIRRNKFDILFDNEPKHDNVGNDLDPVYENPTHKKDIKLEQYDQLAPGELTPNINNKSLENFVFDNEPKNTNIGKNMEPAFINPKKTNNTLDKDILFENPINNRKTELDMITNKMKNRKNIGTDLGKLY